MFQTFYLSGARVMTGLKEKESNSNILISSAAAAAK